MALACVIPDITNPFYPVFLVPASVRRSAGYDVLILDTDGRAEGEERATDWLLQGRAGTRAWRETFLYLRSPRWPLWRAR